MAANVENEHIYHKAPGRYALKSLEIKKKTLAGRIRCFPGKATGWLAWYLISNISRLRHIGATGLEGVLAN